MLASESDALQGLLLSVCQRAGLQSLSDLDVQRVLDDIIHRTRSILADVASDWNWPHTCCQLPAEVLALCFKFLPFQSRIHASHVCRVWRVAALDAPSLWADIAEPHKRTNLALPMLELSLSRAGAVPLTLKFSQKLKGETLQLVHRSMHRVAHLVLHKLHDAPLLQRHAPLLHTLRVSSGELRLAENFLGGCPGRLVGLHADDISFVGSCPALSNLTALEFRLWNHMPLQRIFAMCPRLQRLSVACAFWSDAGSIGRLPQTLTDLTLSTFSNDAQLSPIIFVCNASPSLKRVDLTLQSGCDTNDLGPALHGVVDLRVRLASTVLEIQALYPAGRRLRLSLGGMLTRYYEHGFPRIFQQGAACFADLNTLHVPLDALERLASDAPPLPALLELSVEIFPTFIRPPRLSEQPEYRWDRLRALASLTPRRVVLNVLPRTAHREAPTPPTADDARALVSVLSDLDTAGPWEVRVAGFAPDVTLSAVGDFTNGLNIAFV